MKMITFSQFDIPELICEALAKRNITTPTAVQKQVIPSILKGKNVIFRSETGTGKTFCYLLPVFKRLLTEERKRAVEIIIVAPTHELGSQIKNEALLLAQDTDPTIGTALCIGGAPLKRQIDMLKQKPSILVGGPARLLELVRLKKLSIHNVTTVILDESDRMLAPEMRDILAEFLSVIPPTAQFIACSATFSRHQADILESIIPKRKNISTEQTAENVAENAPAVAFAKFEKIHLPPEDVLTRNITHWTFFCEGREKIETLRKFIIAEKPSKALVFTAIAGQVENIAAQLVYKKIQCSALHAKMDKVARKKSLDDFKAGRSTVLITSDLSARGLDIPDVSHIIQLDVNENEDFFIHRAGRTARAGKSGINVIFGDEIELRNLSKIEKKLGIIIYPKVIYGGVIRAPNPIDESDQ